MNSPARSRTPFGVRVVGIVGGECWDPGCGAVVNAAFVEYGDED